MGEFLVILLVALLVFGGKLPETARKVGGALSEFKRGMREELRKVEEGVRTDSATPEWRPPTAAPPPPPAAEPTRRDP
jgi:sec-independent protein translocase protein TatA